MKFYADFLNGVISQLAAGYKKTIASPLKGWYHFFRENLKRFSKGDLPMEHRPKLYPSWRVRILAAAIIVETAFLLPACKGKKKPAVPPAPVVIVMEAARRDVPVSFEFVAQTQSSHLVNIQARVNGFLDRRMYT